MIRFVISRTRFNPRFISFRVKGLLCRFFSFRNTALVFRSIRRVVSNVSRNRGATTLGSIGQGIVHTYPEICENADFFLRIWLTSTRIQRVFRPYPEIFENALFLYVYVWTVVSGNFRIRFRHSLGSSLHGEHYKQTWRTAR